VDHSRRVIHNDMLPAGGFQFAVCGLASFAATVGYAYSRKRVSRSMSEAPTRSIHDEARHKRNEDIEKSSFSCTDGMTTCASSPFASDSEKLASIVAEPVSLKRKREDDDVQANVGYPYNLSSIYPNKRSRTPSSESDSDEMPLTEEGYLLVGSPSRLMVVQQQDPVIPDVKDASASCETGHEEVTDKIDDVKSPVQPSISGTSEPLPLVLSDCEPLHSTTTAPARPPIPPTQIASKPSPTHGFAAFASAGSAFRSNVDASTSPLISEKPIWWSDGSRQSKQFENPLAAESHVKTTYTHSTGEEDEDVELELKGVKLFIKRGQKDFTDGIIGNIKLLSHKTKQEGRLLFRRDPLWQVSLNVRLHPLVRCTYDTEAKALRLILKEPVEQENVPPEQWPQELVVYALKAGRVPKEDFREFAKTLSANPHFTAKDS